MKKDVSTKEWKVEGEYFEGCNCKSICPCIFLNDPTEGNCKLTSGWHIQNGYYGQISLDGLNVVGIFFAPGNMVIGPKWKAALYLDERASKEQTDALGKIFSGQAGGFLANVAVLIGEVIEVKSVPIKFGIEGMKRWMYIPEILEIEIEGIMGGDPKFEATVTNPPLYAAAGFNPVISHSNRDIYHDHGLEWDNTGKNGFYSRFAYYP